MVEDLKKKINENPDFINSKRHKFSITNFAENNPNGTTDNVICHLLNITPEELRSLYQGIIEKAKKFFKA